MLPDIGASELLVIAVVALIVVGPKDLPLLLRKLGQFMARLRGMAAEFRSSFDEMARQSELEELRKEVEAMRRGQVFESIGDGVSDKPVLDVISDIEQGLADSGGQFHPPMSHQFPSSFEAEPVQEPAPVVEPPPKAPRKPRAKAAPKVEDAAPVAVESAAPKRKRAAKAGAQSGAKA
jgi:sec-independent protein translocase protein TatB